MKRIRPRGSYIPHAVDLIDHSQVQRPPFFLHQHEEEEESRTGHDGFDGPWRTTMDARSSKANRSNNRSKELFNLENQPISKSTFSKKRIFVLRLRAMQPEMQASADTDVRNSPSIIVCMWKSYKIFFATI